MSVLDLKEGSTVGHNITLLYLKTETHQRWLNFVKSLDPNIIKVDGVKGFTRITFKSDEHKTWFILRWS
jgi:hypothetical protein